MTARRIRSEGGSVLTCAGLAAAQPPRQTAVVEVAPLSIIWPLLGRHIAFHRRLVDVTASVKAALLLSQSIYWTRHGRDVERSGGWFHKTTAQWEMETGLSAKEQTSARARLRSLALLEDVRSGIPARMHFRLNANELGVRLSARIASHQNAANWREHLVLAELLGPSLAFHRTLAALAGGVHAGLMLSRALHLTRLQARNRVDDWIASSAAYWFEDIGLTRREQETARRDLLRTGFWEESLRGIPPSLMARIRLDCLLARLADDATADTQREAPVADPDRGVATDRCSPKGQTSLREHRSLVRPKAPSLFHPNRHHGFAESAISHMDHSTSELLQPQHTAHAAIAADAIGGGELIFPEQMLPAERQAARLLLRGYGEQAQCLLDELAARLELRAVRVGAVAYLRGLIARAKAGTFVAELGPRVAAERRRRQDDARQRSAWEAEAQRLAVERATPEYQARVQLQRHKLREIVDGLKARTNVGGAP